MNRREFFQTTTAAALAPAAASAAGSFKAGYADRDVSPKIGMEQPSGYGKLYHTKFHDPCKVRAAVFDDGTSRAALVGVDAGMVPRSLVLAVRREVERRCGIPSGAIMIGASHSHSSGPIGGVEPGEYDKDSELVQRLAYKHSINDNPEYREMVQTQAIEAICEADRKRAAGRSGVGVGREDKVAFNRRLRMKNGQSWTHPGQGNPDIVGFAGPVDPAVGVIGTWDADGRLLGCVVNFCCHATTSPPGISANYIYYLEQVIRGVFGKDVVVVFLQGFSGDVTQVDNLSPYRRQSGDEEARFVGGRIGAEAVKVLLSMYPDSLAPVVANSTILQIPRRVPSPERVKRCLELVQQDPKAVGITEWTFAKEIVILDAKIRRQPTAETEVQAIQLGPVALISSPAEMFCEFGLDLRRRSGFPLTFPVELANGSLGYVPTEEAFGPHGGGYETRMTTYTHLIPTAGRQMVDAGVALAARMQPGRVPERPKAPPFSATPGGIGSTPWTYGSVPPELK